MKAREHIVIDAGIQHGKPVIRGTRVPVARIIAGLAGGMTREEVMREYEISSEDVLCLLSADSGFADIRNYPPEKYSGIVVPHLPARATSVAILALLQSLLVQAEVVDHLGGKPAIVQSGRIRVRKG